MRFISPFLIIACLWSLSVNVQAADRYPSVEVVEAYINLRTGPGRGYPVFYIAERGEWIEVIRRRTDWFEVRTERDKVGWVHRED
ncbi:MAG: SH3 domain-containing protein, partial [Ketobacteraceae bacterium]|nr:SH3 domain-containing protein [Ketobacteraceae bacterium]